MQMEFISGKLPNLPGKFVVYGPEGIGKSTFASKFPTPLFIDTEDSTLKMDVTRMQKPTSWTMLTEQVKYIRNNPGSWQTLNLDTADWAEQLCIEHLCSQHHVNGIEAIGGGWGKGYTYLEEEFGRFLNLLTEIRDIGINIVITAHAILRKIEQPDEIGSYDHWELKLEKKVAALVKEWADTILFANYKTFVVNIDNQGAQKGKNKAQGGKRMMYTTHNVCWDAKNRDDLADELPFEYSSIAHIPYARPVQTAAEMVKEYEAAQKKAAPPTLEADLKEPVAGFDGPATRVEPLPPEPEQPITAAEQLIMDNAPEPMDGVPKPLADLMAANGVTVAEIQQVVGMKGYYPPNTPISNYDPQFIAGVLVGAWAQVYGAIEANRKKAS